jgi:hypothetical protein
MSGFKTAADYAAAIRAAHEEYRLGGTTLREHLFRTTALWSEILNAGLADEVQAEIERDVE